MGNTKYCTECGSPNQPTSSYCSNCGNPISLSAIKKKLEKREKDDEEENEEDGVSKSFDINFDSIKVDASVDFGRKMRLQDIAGTDPEGKDRMTRPRPKVLRTKKKLFQQIEEDMKVKRDFDEEE